MRTLRWAFIFFQCLWLNVVVPGHTRGAMAVPGSKRVGAVVSNAGGCCKAKSASQQEAPLDPSRCAVCHYALGLSLPPVYSYDHRPAGLIGLLPVPAVQSVAPADVHPAFFERGPPVM